MRHPESKAQPVRVGMVGAGYAANLHAEGYHRLKDLDVEIVAVAASSRSSAERFSGRHGIDHAGDDAFELIQRDDINLIDLCVPNKLHEPLAIASAEAGKQIICEKPLTGYFGEAGSAQPAGHTERATMFAEAVASAERIVQAAERHSVQLMYAENWLYAPAITRAARLAEASQGAILEIRAQECHSGSHARYAKSWAQAGGGALLRLGAHPIGAALWLKEMEGLRRYGAPTRVASVTAEAADLSRLVPFSSSGQSYLVDDWRDVENWSAAILTFTDGTRAVINASDIVLGGIEDTLEMLLSNCRICCDMSHHGAIRAYAPDERAFGDEYIMEKLSTSAGWSTPAFEEDYMLGYPQEMRDFCECVTYGRQPRATGALGLEVTKVIYAAYQSAQEGRRVALR